MPNTASKPARIVGWILTAIPIFMMGIGSIYSLVSPGETIQAMTEMGLPERLVYPVLFLSLGSVLLYAIPQTAVLGAILVTGYLGGAVLTHLRIGDGMGGDGMWFMAVIIGVIVWLGLFLRDTRVRELVPLRRNA